nr:immunoglobulin light chain junction region [Macaca mulatta]
CQQYNSESRTF